MKRKPLTEEQKENLRKAAQKQAKPVLQLNIYNSKVIARYSSLNEAELVTGIDRKTISLAARGFAKRAGFYKWRWA